MLAGGQADQLGPVVVAEQAGRIDEIRAYCETDVVNTYLMYCRFQLMRGGLMPDAYAREVAVARGYISSQDAAHWRQFLAGWAQPETSIVR